MSSAEVTGLHIPVKLAGKPYKAGRWELVDFAAWEEFVRHSYRERAKEDTDGLSEEVKEKLQLAVHLQAAKITFLSPESLAMLSTVTGFVRVWWIGLVKFHPEITEDEICSLLLDPRTDYKEMEKMEILGDALETPKKKRTVKKKEKKTSHVRSNELINWKQIFRLMAEKYPWASNAAVGRLTLYQLVMYMEDSASVGSISGTTRFATMAEAEANKRMIQNGC